MPEFPQLSLPTERLLLHPLRESDATAIFAIRSDPLVMRYHSSAPWTGIALAEALIARDLKGMAQGEYLRLGLERVEDGLLIGTCCLFDFDQQCHRAELGYDLRHAACGMGPGLYAGGAAGVAALWIFRIGVESSGSRHRSAQCRFGQDFGKAGLCQGRLSARTLDS